MNTDEVCVDVNVSPGKLNTHSIVITVLCIVFLIIYVFPSNTDVPHYVKSTNITYYYNIHNPN